MTTARIDFAALGRAERVEPVMLVAGVPCVFTVGGTRPTAFAASGSSTFDPLWWPGTFATITLPDASSWYTVRDLLDPRTVWTTRQAVDLAKGDVSVEPLPVDILDREEAATAILSRRQADAAALLATEASDTATTWDLSATTGFAAAGVAHCGREVVYYGSITAGALDITSHGKFGSKAAIHKVNPNRPPVVVGGTLPRYVQGRRAAVFLCRVSEDGATLYDPTLWHLGIVGAGVQLVSGGTRWQVTLDSITEVLRTAPDLSVDLYGWQHARNQSPLTAQGGASYLHEIGPETNGGWSPNFDVFKEVWNIAARAASQPFLIRTDARGNAGVSASVSGSFTAYSWLDPMTGSWEGTGGGVLFEGAPDTCLLLDGVLYLSADHYARIPAVLDWSVSTPAPGTARYTLTADTDETEGVHAVITEVDGTAKTVTVRADVGDLAGAPRAKALRITKRTSAKLGVLAQGDTAIGALKALVLAVDAIGGADDESAAIDWDHLAATFRSVPASSIPETRTYRIGASDDTLFTLLSDEARIRGCNLAVRRGRVTAIRAASFASSEAIGATEITAEDQLCDANGARVPFEVIDQPEPPVTRLEFELRDGTVLAYQDDTFASEFGTARAVQCRAMVHVPPAALSLAGLAEAIGRHAQSILGVLAEPQRIVRIPLGPRFLGLEPGDIVTLTHAEIPNWDGTRGVTDAVCQVDEVSREVFGGSGRVTASLRLSETSLGGYAPAALVAAGGISGGSTTVTLDTTSGFGASCFAPPDRDPSYGFAVGDVVVLSQYDSETITVAEIQRTITAVGTNTITIDSAPSAGMVTQAAAAYGVVIRTAMWTAVTADQKDRSAFIANDSTTAFSDSAAPKRWAA